MNGIVGGFYRVSEWIMRLAYVNLLWLIFTLLGLIVFGFFPAYTAMLSVIRKWVMGDDDIPVFRTFISVYKKEFIKSNIIGILLALIGYILYIDLSIIKEASGIIQLTYYPLILIFIGYILSTFYIFPIIVHYNTTVLHALKNSVLIMMLSPFSTIAMMTGLIAVYLLMTTIPGLIPIFCGSSIAFIIMWSALLAFSKVERRQGAQTQKQSNRAEAQ